jgi:crossover junction endodeoxyribonuclease RuvC
MEQTKPTILGIDPGTNCGWAIKRNGRMIASGTWNLKGGRFEGGGMRYVHLQANLTHIWEAFPSINLVAFEEVRRHMGVDAAHVYGGIIATITAWCETVNIPYTAIAVGTVKKMATGKGNSKKDAMIAAANAKWPELPKCEDDNEADARFIAEAAA